jgi:arylsulfatase A
MFHGQSLYGELLRVPLIFWRPGRVPRGLKIDDPVGLIDVMPTVLEMAGLPVPREAQGRSLRPLLTAGGKSGGAASGWTPRPVIAERQPQGNSDFLRGVESYAVMEGDWKLIHNVGPRAGRPEFELFEFLSDPLDQKNVAAEHPDVVDHLAKQLESWHRMASQAKLKPDSEETKGMTAEQLEHLRSLGYIQ